jgi:hypothetical protein
MLQLSPKTFSGKIPLQKYHKTAFTQLWSTCELDNLCLNLPSRFALALKPCFFFLKSERTSPSHTPFLHSAEYFRILEESKCMVQFILLSFDFLYFKSLAVDFPVQNFCANEVTLSPFPVFIVLWFYFQEAVFCVSFYRTS